MYDVNDPDDLARAAEEIAAGGIVGFFFNGAYALLGDADRVEAADRIFEVKRRPRTRTLSLVTDPRHWADFVDVSAIALRRFPLDGALALHDRLHALGVIYPAAPTSAPPHLVQDGTVLNVWSRYDPLIELQAACRARGLRALQGASANRSGDATYTTAAEMVDGFGDEVPVVFAEEEVAPERRRSTSLLDLTGGVPTLLREGNTSEREVAEAVAAVGFGRLVRSASFTRV